MRTPNYTKSQDGRMRATLRAEIRVDRSEHQELAALASHLGISTRELLDRCLRISPAGELHERITMARFWVELPITGTLCREIEAADADEAIEAGLSTPATDEEVREMQWEATRDVITGNVFHGIRAHATAQEIKE